MKRMAHESTALGALQRSTAKHLGQRLRETSGDDTFKMERSYRKRVAKDMRNAASKSKALKSKKK